MNPLLSFLFFKKQGYFFELSHAITSTRFVTGKPWESFILPQLNFMHRLDLMLNRCKIVKRDVITSL